MILTNAGSLRLGTCAMKLAVLAGAVQAQVLFVVQAQTAASFAGRPFVQVARSGANDPTAGIISWVSQAQVVGDSVVFVAQGESGASGVFRGRGGPLTKVAGSETAVPGGSLRVFQDGFARDATTGNQLVIAAGGSRADALYLTDGTEFTALLAPGSLLPNSGNKVVNQLGEPYFAGGEVAVFAAHQPEGGGAGFQGVYRVKAGALETVADTATALPGGFGVPDGFGSQVGFDGQSVAFWASKGGGAETEGMFVQGANRTIELIARTGDTFPGGGVMRGFKYPPVATADGVVFFAGDSTGADRLLSFANGTLTVLAKDGDLTPEGDPISINREFGIAADGARVMFPAATSHGGGLYLIESGILKTVIDPRTTVAGFRPMTLVLRDWAKDTIVCDAFGFGAGRGLIANLAAPAVPVIVNSPTNQSFAPGVRVELQVSALGDAPLAYQWRWTSPTGLVVRSTTDTLVIESVQVADVGLYSVTVTNAAGTATAEHFFLNVAAAPQITATPLTSTIEVGDQLFLSVAATGGQPLSYTWFKDGLPATNPTDTQGQFIRKFAGAQDAGRYKVVVSNAWGTATSSEALVTVKAAAPNPVFGGWRFVKIIDATTPLPGRAIPFHTEALRWDCARFMGNGIVFVSGAAGQPQGGVFLWSAGALTTLLMGGTELPNGLGQAEGFTLVTAPAEESLAVAALKTRFDYLDPVGFYRYDGFSFSTVADTTTPAPEGGGALFQRFYPGAVAASGRTLFIAHESVYLADASGLSRVLTQQQDLPVVGTTTTQFYGLSYDGQRFTVMAMAADYRRIVALQISPEGVITRLLATGDPIPRTSDTVDYFGGHGTDNGVSHLMVFVSNPSASHVVEWRNGELTRIAGPGMSVGTFGTIQTLEEGSNPKAREGRSFLTATVATPNGLRRGIVAASATGIAPVLFTAKLDARPVASTYAVDSDGERVLVLVDFVGGGRALYANVGPVDEGPLTLQYTRPTPGTLRFTVPPGAALEAAGALGQAWQPVDGAGEVEVTVDGDARFFRLRRN